MLKNIIILVLLAIAGILLVSPNKLRFSTNTQDDITPVIKDVGINKEGKQDARDDNDTTVTATGAIKKPKQGTTLNLSNQNLTTLPKSVLQNTKLEILDISNNNLTGALPAEIKNLKNLRVLTANNNQMTGIPAEIGQLQNLEVLNLANNQLTGLPYELGNLKNLKLLDLSGNDYAEQDLTVIKSNLPSTTQIIL